ncbi:MAG: hypothetical protein H9893_13260 [Candidatus Niameybacter stercoravium]|nr:hypothetical protein [Candidatus Niameybacter stercoravium]
MRKAVALVIMIVVCSIYFIAMNDAENGQQGDTSTSTLVEVPDTKDERLIVIEDIIEEIEKEYPPTPKFLMETNNTIMVLQYDQGVTPEVIEETVKALEMLYSEEALSRNTYSSQLEWIEEIRANKEADVYLVGSTIDSITFPTPEKAFVEVTHEMTKKMQKRQYTLIKQDGLWKIDSYKELAESER